MKKILMILVTLFLFNINVSAASLCDYTEQTELNSKAANVKVNYEIINEILQFDDGIFDSHTFKIQILNLTDDFYITVKNDYNEEENTYFSSDAVDGIITFEWGEIDDIVNFTFQVYTTNNTSCPDEKYKTIYLTTPRYNEYSNWSTCEEFPDYYLCQKFVTFEKIDDIEFMNKIDSYKSDTVDEAKKDSTENQNLSDKIFEFIDDNKWYIIGGIIIIIGGSFIFYRIKIKKQRELGI